MTEEAGMISHRRTMAGWPDSLSDDSAFDKVVEEVFEHVHESYFGEGKSKYAAETTG